MNAEKINMAIIAIIKILNVDFFIWMLSDREKFDSLFSNIFKKSKILCYLIAYLYNCKISFELISNRFYVLKST